MTTVLKIQGSKGEKNLSYKFQDQDLDFVTENCDYYFIQNVSGSKNSTGLVYVIISQIESVIIGK